MVAGMLGALTALSACGGSGAGEGAGEPLVSGSMQGEYKGQSFVPVFGFSTLYQGSNLIAVGDGPLNCASPQRTEPPSGTNAVFAVPMLAVGSYPSVLVQLLQNKGNYESVGSNSGTIMITAVTDASVAGSVAYSYTDDAGQTYGLSGTFEVSRCP
jgi:hypothetical protein